MLLATRGFYIVFLGGNRETLQCNGVSVVYAQFIQYNESSKLSTGVNRLNILNV
jgi:hypothetical protein